MSFNTFATEQQLEKAPTLKDFTKALSRIKSFKPVDEGDLQSLSKSMSKGTGIKLEGDEDGEGDGDQVGESFKKLFRLNWKGTFMEDLEAGLPSKYTGAYEWFWPDDHSARRWGDARQAGASNVCGYLLLMGGQPGPINVEENPFRQTRSTNLRSIRIKGQGEVGEVMSYVAVVFQAAPVILEGPKPKRQLVYEAVAGSANNSVDKDQSEKLIKYLGGLPEEDLKDTNDIQIIYKAVFDSNEKDKADLPLAFKVYPESAEADVITKTELKALLTMFGDNNISEGEFELVCAELKFPTDMATIIDYISQGGTDGFLADQFSLDEAQLTDIAKGL